MGKWNWRDDYGVHRASIGLVHLAVTKWTKTKWYASCTIGPSPDARDRHLQFEGKRRRTLEAAQRQAEKLAPELLLGGFLALVELMTKVGVEIPNADDPDIREVGDGDDGDKN